MGIIECFMVPCVFVEREKTPDGSGGWVSEWVDGTAFSAAIIRDTSTEAQIAEATGTVERYTVTVSRSIHLPFHAVIKRLEDGKTFRITSDNAEKQAPACSALDIAQSTAEAWVLT